MTCPPKRRSREGWMRGAIAWAAASCACLTVSCGRDADRAPALAPVSAAAPAASGATARVAYTAHGKPYFIDLPVPR